MKEVIKNQIKFQELLGNDTTTQEFKNQMFLGLMEEVVELMKETPFKAHKKHQEFNKEQFIEEAVDVQLYLLNLVISSGYSYEEFIGIIVAKQQKNIKRQQSGY